MSFSFLYLDFLNILHRKCISVDTVGESSYNKELKKGRRFMNEINGEEKRNQIWKIIMAVSTVVIICIAAFFITKFFMANPLEGKWSSEDTDLVMTIRGDGKVELEWPQEYEDAEVSVVTKYNLDKETKTFTINVSEEALREAAEDSDDSVTADTLESAANQMEGTFDYSIENKQLILTDREYGEKMVFVKK